MRTPRKTKATGAPPPPSQAAARGRRAHAGPPADEPRGPDRNRNRNPDRGAEQDGDRGSGGRRPADGGARPHQDPAAPGRPISGPRPARWSVRPRTVRAKIVSLLMVPVVSLLALWGFATVTTAQDVARLRQLQRVDAQIREPVAAAVTALQAERRAAVRQVAAPSSGRAAEVQQQGRRTDAAVARLGLDGGHTVADAGDLPEEVADRIREFVDRSRKLPALRTSVVDAGADWDTVYEQYTATLTSAFAVGGALTGIQDTQPGSDARVLLEFSRATEMLAREDALLTSAHLATEMTAERQRAFTGAVETRRHLTESATADLRGPERAAWRSLTAQRGYRLLTDAEDRVRTAPAGRKAAQIVPANTWDDAQSTVRGALLTLETDGRRAAADRADPFAGGLVTAAGAAVLCGLAAVAASLVISVRIGRALVVELVTLRNTALEIARHKLPHAMRRLRAGEEIDVHAEAPPGFPEQDEIGQVGDALTTVHRAALSAAVERAELASGISGVFVNLARRSQVLVHRQLTLLDSMERRADDPNELGDLFRLDHLTTRMRRHAESLIILSGAAPGRAWRMPVPLTNVVRAAVSEIEDYARVEVRHLPETAVIGAAVADLTHLLAELVENAAQFSPPHTKVRVSGEPVGNGYALEIEDRGLGMGKETLAEANRRIEQSEALNLFDSDRLGLFVVSRLSSRHDIKVHLRTSPYGGTTAVVLLPTALLQAALPAGPGRSARPGELPGGHRGDGAPRTEQTRAPAPPAGPRPVRPRSASPAPTASHPALEALAYPEPHETPGPPGRQPTPVTSLRMRGRASQDDGHGPGGPGGPGAPSGTDRPDRPVGPDPRLPSGPSDDTGSLPRRVRQSHLVPQLRQAPTPEPAVYEPPADDVRRTPEQARDRMAAYRDGWARGGGAAPGGHRARFRPSGAGDERGHRPSNETGSAPRSEGDDA